MKLTNKVSKFGNSVSPSLLGLQRRDNIGQGLDNKLIDPVDDIGKTDGEIACRERLGGMLKFYHRKAA